MVKQVRQTLSARVKTEILDQIEAMGVAEGLTKSQVVEKLLDIALSQYPDKVGDKQLSSTPNDKQLKEHEARIVTLEAQVRTLMQSQRPVLSNAQEIPQELETAIVSDQGITNAEFAKRHNISVSTLEKWKVKMKEAPDFAPKGKDRQELLGRWEVKGDGKWYPR